MLRDWNSGKIPYCTEPPLVHPSSAPPPPTLRNDMNMGDSAADARILTTLSEAFTIDGLFDNLGDEAVAQEDDTLEQGRYAGGVRVFRLGDVAADSISDDLLSASAHSPLSRATVTIDCGFASHCST